MGSFSIKYSYDPETNQYIAFIPELNLSDFGDTIFDAEKNLGKQLKLYIEELKINNVKSLLSTKIFVQRVKTLCGQKTILNIIQFVNKGF